MGILLQLGVEYTITLRRSLFASQLRRIFQNNHIPHTKSLRNQTKLIDKGLTSLNSRTSQRSAHSPASVNSAHRSRRSRQQSINWWMEHAWRFQNPQWSSSTSDIHTLNEISKEHDRVLQGECVSGSNRRFSTYGANGNQWKSSACIGLDGS